MRLMLKLASVFWNSGQGEVFSLLSHARRFTQGVLATLVADTAPPELRGTAFGAFNLASGVALLAASMIAGSLRDRFGPAATFLAGAVFACVALVGFILVQRQPH